jgi:hypothetical protein
VKKIKYRREKFMRPENINNVIFMRQISGVFER